MKKSDLLVLVPAFNEAGSIAKTLRGLNSLDLEIVVIDDGSTDLTAAIARAEGAEVLCLPFNLGVGGALRAGFQHACKSGYKAIVQIDADGQHPTDQIEDLLIEANRLECHMVVGSRFRPKNPVMHVGRLRRIPMWLLARSASTASGTKITDATSGFRLIAQPLLGEFSRSFPAYYLGDTYEALVSAGKGGYTIREIPATLYNREVGVSSASSLQAIKLIIKTLMVVFMRLHFTIKPLSSR